ncbi:unnamed protein product [Closterium sp. NIES-65]|nr:unnamed protein product [Closterium sp. NIES-65]
MRAAGPQMRAAGPQVRAGGGASESGGAAGESGGAACESGGAAGESGGAAAEGGGAAAEGGGAGSLIASFNTLAVATRFPLTAEHLMVAAHGSRYVLRSVLPNRFRRSIFQYGVEHTRLAHIRGIVLSRPHCLFLRLSCSLPSRASPPKSPPPAPFSPIVPPRHFPAGRRAHGTSVALVSTQALLALTLALLLLRSYISRQAAPSQAWSALFPWGCALSASQAGVAARLVVGRAGEVAIGEGAGGWGDTAAASGSVDPDAAGAGASEQRGAGSSGGEAPGEAGGAGRLVEQQGRPSIKEESAGAAGGGDQPAHSAAVGAAAVGVTDGASTAIGVLDGAIPTVDASNGSMSAASNGSEAGVSSVAAELAEHAACEGAALTEEDVRAWQAEEHVAFGHVEVEGGVEGKGVEGGQGGVAEARVNEEVCFTVRALDANGRAFDNGCRQRAFLVALVALQRRQGSTDARTDAHKGGSGSGSNSSGSSADSWVQGSARVTEVPVAVSAQARAAAGRAAVLLEEWEQGAERGQGGQGEDGVKGEKGEGGEEGAGADVRMAARVTYHPGNSTHQVNTHASLPPTRPSHPRVPPTHASLPPTRPSHPRVPPTHVSLPHTRPSHPRVPPTHAPVHLAPHHSRAPRPPSLGPHATCASISPAPPLPALSLPVSSALTHPLPFHPIPSHPLPSPPIASHRLPSPPIPSPPPHPSHPSHPPSPSPPIPPIPSPPSQVCYQLPLPGRYVLSLHLLFSATFPLLRSNARTSFLGGFSNYTVVQSQAIQASAPPTFSLHAHRCLLVTCHAMGPYHLSSLLSTAHTSDHTARPAQNHFSKSLLQRISPISCLLRASLNTSCLLRASLNTSCLLRASLNTSCLLPSMPLASPPSVYPSTNSLHKVPCLPLIPVPLTPLIPVPLTPLIPVPLTPLVLVPLTPLSRSAPILPQRYLSLFSSSLSPIPSPFRATLPYCTPPLLTASHHSGYWMGHLWQPHACRLRRLSPPALHACFKGRSLLFLGDSQLRYTFGFLRLLLRFPSRAAFLTKFAAKPKVSRQAQGDLSQLHHMQQSGINSFSQQPATLPLPLSFISIDPMPPPLHPITGCYLHISTSPSPPNTLISQMFWPNMLACGSVPRGNGSIYPPINSSTGELISTGVCQQPDSAFFFHGENFNGYGRALYKVRAAEGRPAAAFNLTYVSQCGAMKPVLPAWMSDPALVGPTLALFNARGSDGSADAPNNSTGGSSSSSSSNSSSSGEGSSSGIRGGGQGEYDMALVGTTLHDLIQQPTAKAFGALLESNLLSPLLAVMRDRAAVALLGPWAAREDSKPPEFIPVSNNARAMAFEEELLRRLPSTQPGAASALGMMGLTLPRPDLCPDSTHYAWPVTLTILDLWLTPLCAPHASHAPQL